MTQKLARGVLTVEALKARCKVDSVTHCWEWQGTTKRGQARIWTLDHERLEKRLMSAPLAAWNIGYGAAPRPGRLIYRGCCNSTCLNPAHLREAVSRVALGAHQRANGYLKGTAVTARLQSMLLAHKAQGRTFTPLHVIQAVQAAPRTVTGRALAQQLGVTEMIVSRIRTGKLTGKLVQLAAAA